MMKRYISTLCLCFIVLSAWSRQLTPQEAIERARSHSSKAMMPEKVRRTLSLSFTSTDGDDNLFYVMNRPENKGFYILGADDCAPAVLAYSDQGNLDYDAAPAQLKWWLSEYERLIKNAISKGELISTTSAINHEPIDPLLTCEWGQDAPYNMLCTDNGYNSPAGCVATAMAQIMYFHKWPEKGVGIKVYQYDTSAGSVTVRGDFSKSLYDWNSMTDTYTIEDSGAGADAVARLMRDCGVSVEMTYGRGGSGANSYLVPSALSTYFGYSREATTCVRSFYTDQEWEQLLLDELEQGRPVFYSGHTARDEGHAFVCDGYKGDGYFHFNWGWSGIGNGYYLLTGIDALRPSNQGTGGSASGLGFSLNQMIVTHLHKKEADESYKLSSLLCLPDGYEIYVKEGVLCVNTPFCNYGTTSSSASNMLAVKLVQGTDTTTVQVGDFGTAVKPGYGYSKVELPVNLRRKLTGTFEVFPVYSTTYSTNTFGQKVFSDYREFLLPPYYQHAIVEYNESKPQVVAQGGVPTAIKQVKQTENTQTDVVYDLQGRAVNAVRSRGLYIKGGKKYLNVR